MAQDQPKQRQGNGASTLGPNSEIGRKLKQYYDELVTEEVPDRFAELLRELEASEQKSGTRKGGA